jgi:hypothetical protein
MPFTFTFNCPAAPTALPVRYRKTDPLLAGASYDFASALFSEGAFEVEAHPIKRAVNKKMMEMLIIRVMITRIKNQN